MIVRLVPFEAVRAASDKVAPPDANAYAGTSSCGTGRPSEPTILSIAPARSPVAPDLMASCGPDKARPYASSNAAARLGSGILCTVWHVPADGRTDRPIPDCKRFTLG